MAKFSGTNTVGLGELASAVLASNAETIAGTLTTKAVAPSSLRDTFPWFNVRSYGAVGNGITNDAAAIQAAIDAAAAVAPAEVRIPRRTYGIQPVAGSFAIKAKPGVTLRAEPGAKFKVLASASTYESIIGHISSDDVSGFSVIGLTFDYNANNNAAPVVGGAGTAAAVKIERGTNIRIQDCTFLDINSINTVIVNGFQVSGETSLSNAWITDCTFSDVHGTAHDHSSIYTVANDVVISGNSFTARDTAGAPAFSAVCAIEIHGGAHRVIGNNITGFREAINGTGIAFRSDTQVISGNTITKCLRGIRLYATALAGGADPALRTAAITGNAIYIDPDYWAAVDNTQPAQGIGMTNVASESYEELLIADNDITFKAYTGTDTDVASLSAAGIAVYRSGSLDTTCKNVSITGNAIRGSLGPGIYIQDRIDGLLVADNLIQDAGHSAIVADDSRSGIYCDGGLRYASIQNNVIFDSRATGYTMRGVAWVATDAVTADNQIVDNYIRLADALSLSINVYGANTGAPLVRHVVRSGLTNLPYSPCAHGSIWVAGALVKIQSSAVSGTVWTDFGPNKADVIGDLNLTGTGGAGYMSFVEQSANPAAPAANGARLFSKDNGAGKTQLVVRFATGAVQVIATEP